MTRVQFTTTLSIIIATLVLVSSMHMAQMFGAAVVMHDDGKKISHDDTTVVKVASDMHHHADKTGSQLIKEATDHQVSADHRSLRLVHKKDGLRNRIASQWLRLWQAITPTLV